MQTDVIALIILGACVFLFLTEWIPLAVTGCLGCLLMGLFQVSSFGEEGLERPAREGAGDRRGADARRGGCRL